MVDKLVRYCGVGMDQIAVLSPYRAQCHVIREGLTDERLSKLNTRSRPSVEQP